MPTKRKTSDKPDTAADPNRLIRERAGSYRSADGRFEVQQSATGWFVIDTSATNELGQPLMRGGFATLDKAKAALPEARSGQVGGAASDAFAGGATPSGGPASKRDKPEALPVKKPAAEPTAKPAPRTWVDDLSSSERSRVRTLINLLEREGVPASAKVVRADREGLLPAVATALVRRRLQEIVDEVPLAERKSAGRIAARVAEVITAGGTGNRAPLPGWVLLETEGSEPTKRRITLRS